MKLVITDDGFRNAESVSKLLLSHAARLAQGCNFLSAELIIDHAYGREPTTINDIKKYKSKTNCISSGQVLSRDYNFEEALIIVKEMADILTIELKAKKSYQLIDK